MQPELPEVRRCLHRHNLNEEIPDADVVVLLRVHHKTHWHTDLRLTVRALMAECRQAGLHFWLLHQVLASVPLKTPPAVQRLTHNHEHCCEHEVEHDVLLCHKLSRVL